jgi:hypothetical protein
LGLYLVIAIGGLIYLSFQLSIANAGFELFILAWLIIYLLLLNKNNLTVALNKISSARFIFWLFFFSVTITGVIVLENNKKELRSRKHYAETLSTKADPSSETLLNTLLTDFRNDYLAANFYRLQADSSNQFFKDSLVNGNFSGYTNKYETKIFTFDSSEAPLFNKEDAGFDELNTVLKTQAKPTNIPELFYYDVSYDRFSYISRKTVTNYDGDTLGYVFVLANPKKYKTDACVAQYLSKGRPCLVNGRLQSRSWEDKESGAKRSKVEVNAQDVTFLGGPGGGDGGNSGNSGGSSASSSKPAGKKDDVVIEDIGDEPINLDDIPF